MIAHLFSIYDVKAMVFHAPFLAHNDADAMRMVSVQIGKPETMYARFPEDYRLMYCGQWNDNSGVIDPETPRFVCEVYSLLAEGAKGYNNEEDD